MLILNNFMITGVVKTQPMKFQTKTGKSFVTFEILTERPYTDVNGYEIQDTFTFKFWGDNGDFVMSLQVGELVGIKGRIQSNAYSDKNNITRYSVELCADTISVNR